MQAHPAAPVSSPDRRVQPGQPAPRPFLSSRIAGLQVGICQRIRFGETSCGDGVLFINRERPLVGIVTGAGRGHTATAAARAFCLYATQHSDDPLAELMAGASEALRHTTGASAALLRLDDDGRALELAVAGAIGVRTDGPGRLGGRGSADRLLGRGDPRVAVERYDLSYARLVLLHSAGVGLDADPAGLVDMGAQDGAEHVVKMHRLRNADATAIVVRLG